MPSPRLAGSLAVRGARRPRLRRPRRGQVPDGAEAHRPAGQAGGGLPLPAPGEEREEDADDARDRHGRYRRAGLPHRRGRHRRLRSPGLLRRLSRRHHGGHPDIGAVPGLGPAPRVCAVRTEGRRSSASARAACFPGWRSPTGPTCGTRCPTCSRPRAPSTGATWASGRPTRARRRIRAPRRPGSRRSGSKLLTALNSLPRRDARQRVLHDRALAHRRDRPAAGRQAPDLGARGSDQHPDPEGVSRTEHHAHRHRARLGHLRGVRGRGLPPGPRPSRERPGSRGCPPTSAPTRSRPGLDEATTMGLLGAAGNLTSGQSASAPQVKAEPKLRAYVKPALRIGARRPRYDPLADHALNLAAVGAALRLAHHRTHHGADRLVVAGPDLLDRVRVLGHGALHDLLELVATRHGPGRAPPRSRPGRPPSRPARRAPPWRPTGPPPRPRPSPRAWPAPPARDGCRPGPRRRSARPPRSRPSWRASAARRTPRPRPPPAGRPARRGRRAAAPRRPRCRARARAARRGLRAAPAAPRGRARASPRWARAAPGPAPGSSGSRAPPPSSAAR